jgi:hypothetical protein
MSSAHATSLKVNMTANVEENIKKARRSAYICSLFGGGFHGHNGLDVETIVHLYKIYISPVLLYGLELILPTTSSLVGQMNRNLVLKIYGRSL